MKLYCIAQRMFNPMDLSKLIHSNVMSQLDDLETLIDNNPKALDNIKIGDRIFNKPPIYITDYIKRILQSHDAETVFEEITLGVSLVLKEDDSIDQTAAEVYSRDVGVIKGKRTKIIFVNFRMSKEGFELWMQIKKMDRKLEKMLANPVMIRMLPKELTRKDKYLGNMVLELVDHEIQHIIEATIKKENTKAKTYSTQQEEINDLKKEIEKTKNQTQNLAKQIEKAKNRKPIDYYSMKSEIRAFSSELANLAMRKLIENHPEIETERKPYKIFAALPDELRQLVMKEINTFFGTRLVQRLSETELASIRDLYIRATMMNAEKMLDDLENKTMQRLSQ